MCITEDSVRIQSRTFIYTHTLPAPTTLAIMYIILNVTTPTLARKQALTSHSLHALTSYNLHAIVRYFTSSIMSATVNES